MIFDYGFSVAGKSHIANGTVCQDAHMIKKLDNGWFVAAVADGVGSAKNSHIGSKLATQTAVEFCCEYMPWDYNLISIKSMLRTAYNYAFKKILRESEKTKQPIESYDTTLTLAIYDGKRIIYGHSGDGAIIGLTIFGDYVEITRPQKGADGISVMPLRAGYTHWKIDAYEEDLRAVMLMTDGVLDTLCPYLLKDVEKNANTAYVPLASFFADCALSNNEAQNSNLKADIKDFLTAKDDYDSEKFYDILLKIYKKHIPKEASEIVEKIKKSNYPISLMQKQQDDKTMVALINTDSELDDKQAEFYSEPNWDEMQDAWNRKAYPHLYKEKEDAKKAPSSAPEDDKFKDFNIITKQNSTAFKTSAKDEKIFAQTFKQAQNMTLSDLEHHIKLQSVGDFTKAQNESLLGNSTEEQIDLSITRENNPLQEKNSEQTTTGMQKGSNESVSNISTQYAYNMAQYQVMNDSEIIETETKKEASGEEEKSKFKKLFGIFDK